ncbi:hypothetical protein ASE74_18660 [Pedobacter sp. Leaf216]|uniref:DUF6588 family protein n=1 Tax=Pedobacter sp. Leaf216 TaxID=1735684 RepID=UPI0006FDC6A3|nr:DUF6588 family protein [Pedobacter sp. Leaf216]KQM77265.1 hypothetical protein ASE74_18660 [Pedobacter sp. Leaf216]
MKKCYSLKALGALFLLVISQKANAQKDVGGLFVGGPADATKLVNAYFDPLYKGLGLGLTDGWTNTAKSKGFLKFDVRVSVSAAFVPQSARSYDVNTLGLSTIKPAPGASSIGPTAFGDDHEGGKMQVYTSGGIPTGKFFNLPQGVGFHVVPSAQIQATLGLPKNIEVTLRAMPKVGIGSDLGDLSMIGFGAKVELLPLFMGSTTEKLIPVDIAVAGGFTQYKYNLPLNVNNTQNSDQRIDAKFNGVNFDAIVSKSILFFTPFASIGYQTSKTNLKALGTYKFEDGINSATYVDPISVKQTDIDGVRGSLGFQLKFGFFKFYGSYTAAKYSMVNAGIGLGIGK